MLLMKDGKVQPARVRVSAAPVYTLADLESLAEQYQVEKQGDSTEGLRRLFIRGLMKWLREREAGLAKGSRVRDGS